MTICIFSSLLVKISTGIFALILIGLLLSFTCLYGRYQAKCRQLQNTVIKQKEQIKESDRFKALYRKQFIQYHLVKDGTGTALSEIYPFPEFKQMEYVCVLFHITDKSSPGNPPADNPIMDSLENECRDYFKDYIIKDFYTLSEREGAVLLAENRINTEELYRLCTSILREASRKAPENYTISCSTGKIISGDISIHTAYRTALDTFFNVSPSNSNHVALYSTAMEKETGSVPYPLKLESDLIKEIRRNQPSNCHKLLEEYFHKLEPSGYTTLYNAFCQLIIMIKRIEKQLQLETMPMKQSSREHAAARLSAERMLDILTQQLTQDIIRFHAINLQYDTKRKTVEQIIALVNENAGNPNLTVDFVADNLNFSKNYLRKVFKDVTNQNMSVFLQEAKIKQACHLLVKSDATVQDICEKLDFASGNYFFTFFKKHTGMTPMQYRLMYGQQQINLSYNRGT